MWTRILLTTSLTSAAVHSQSFSGSPATGAAEAPRHPRSGGPVSFLEEAARLEELGRAEAAAAVLRDGLKAQPNDPAARSELAWSRLRAGRFEEARGLFLGLEEPGDLDLLGQGWAELEAGRLDDARRTLSAAAARRPKLALIPFLVARVHERQGRTAEAIASYQAALKLDSYFLEARPPLAALFEKEGRADEAWKQHARVAIVSPADKRAAAGQARLAPSLSRKPEELIPVKTIPEHSPVEAAPRPHRVPPIRVGIASNLGGRPFPKTSVSFRSAAPFTISEGGREAARGAAGETWTIRLKGRQLELVEPSGAIRAAGSPLLIRNGGQRTFILDKLTYAHGYAWGGRADKELRGDVEVSIDRAAKTLVLVSVVNFEEYLYSVLASEMPSRWPHEALRAQAVIARSQAAYRQSLSRPHRLQGYDVCDEQHCQVYAGVASETPRSRSAVDATRGKILAHKDKPAHTIFFSNCGGHTQSGTDVGWADVAYWRPVFDGPGGAPPASLAQLRRWLKSEPAAYCNAGYGAPAEFRWTRLVEARDLEERASRRKPIGRLRAVTVIKRARSGHVSSVRLRGTTGELVVEKEHEIRRLLGLGPLRSTLFVVEAHHRKGLPVAFAFYGGGWGHGVGMCQAGAAGRAEAGFDHGAILGAYYPGTDLKTLYD